MITNIDNPGNLEGLGALKKADQVGLGGGWSMGAGQMRVAGGCGPASGAAPGRPIGRLCSSGCLVRAGQTPLVKLSSPAPQDRIRKQFAEREGGKKGGAGGASSKVRRAAPACVLECAAPPHLLPRCALLGRHRQAC